MEHAGRSLVKTGDPWPDLVEAEQRVLVMQRKLHRWAVAEPGHRFDDLANLVYDPAFLTVGWARVVGNKGARTAGVDRLAPRQVGLGAAVLLEQVREDLKAGSSCRYRCGRRRSPSRRGRFVGWGSRLPVTGSCRRR